LSCLLAPPIRRIEREREGDGEKEREKERERERGRRRKREGERERERERGGTGHSSFTLLLPLWQQKKKEGKTPQTKTGRHSLF
jgi:hypothetical protein